MSSQSSTFTSTFAAMENSFVINRLPCLDNKPLECTGFDWIAISINTKREHRFNQSHIKPVQRSVSLGSNDVDYVGILSFGSIVLPPPICHIAFTFYLVKTSADSIHVRKSVCIANIGSRRKHFDRVGKRI